MGRLSKAEGEQLAQVSNPDPFAAPVWRSPVYRTPEYVIWIVQLLRLLWRVAWFVIRHPGLDVTAGALLLLWINTGWPGLAVLAGAVLVALVALRLAWPYWFARLVTRPVRDRWRWWCYRRRWQAVLTITRLAPLYQGRVLLPVLGRVNSSRFTDRVAVGLVSGQSPKDFADRAEGLAHGFRVRQCRVRAGRPGTITLELVRRHAPADPLPPQPGGDPGGAAGRRVGGRDPVHAAAACHAPADRRGHRRGEGLLPVGAGAGDAPGDGGRAGPGACGRPEA